MPSAKWTKLDILHRAPDKYELYRRKAIMELRKRELKSPVDEKIQFAVEKLFLYDNDWIQQKSFQYTCKWRVYPTYARK